MWNPTLVTFRSNQMRHGTAFPSVRQSVKGINCRIVYNAYISRSRPNWIAGLGPKSEPAGKSESRGPENWVSRWRRPNSDIYSQNHHFGLVYDMIYQFLGMEAKNYKFGMFCQQCHPSVASGNADIRPRNASRIHTCHLFTSQFCLYLQFGELGRQIPRPKLLEYCFQ